MDANDKYETYRLIQGKCFYFEWKHKIFEDAKENCKQKGGKLYEPMDVVMMKKIAKMSAIVGRAWAWIGITDTAKGRVRSCDSSMLIRCTPILIWSFCKESAIWSILMRE